MNWSDRRLIELFGIDHPIVQAPMAGFVSPAMVVAVVRGRWAGLDRGRDGRRPRACARSCRSCARARAGRSTSTSSYTSPARAGCRRASSAGASGSRRSIASSACLRMPAPAGRCAGSVRRRPVRRGAGVQAQGRELPFRPARAGLVKRLKDERIAIVSSATTAAEARWLEGEGVDAVIAQGAEAGGHRGMFLVDDIARQAGTMALVPQVVDAVKVPVIAAGGIGDGRGIAAALALGAAGVQMGTAFLLTPEARTPRAASRGAEAGQRRQHDAHQPVHRPTGARHRQPLHRGGRADERRRAAISAGGRRRRSRSGRLRRPRVRPTSCPSGAARRHRWRARCRRGPDRVADARDRGGAQARAGMTASRSWSTKPRVIGAWPISRR